jgi:23S rRNA (guanosine2251-2'-O)-methyltransferase
MQLIVIAHNIRSTHNVGAILRSCDGFGVSTFWATGYTPYPTVPGDTRLPHLRGKQTRQIAKTALGAETTVSIGQSGDITSLLNHYNSHGFTIAALEQGDNSVNLTNYEPPEKLVLLLGEEVHGVAPELLERCDVLLEIPMRGRKESFNVSVATGIALYALTNV